MPTLDPSLRDLLATVIGKENADGGARVVAEAGARAAIEALAVHLPAPHAHLDTAGKHLRVRLRARAKQLGDARYDNGRYEIGRLVEQAAYEHWHRMLFARFLAENNLLIHPEMNVAVTLEECAELAASEGATDGWELAGRYASRMLPQIFRPDDPLLAVRFAIDDVRKLENLLDSLPAELFRASDSLGWCYQFWQARNKKEINASEVRIGAKELPAVTQLFTEPYMVQFLLHNTLGAWWIGAGRTLPMEMPNLRLDHGAPAAGTFESWPRLARELKVLDPCCGSGHFLVAVFEILVAFRMAEEGLSAREACDAVLRDNLFGLELDARCVQIAAFALAMAAWTFPDSGGYRPLAPMNVACSGLALSATKEEWERLGEDNTRLRSGMGRMWELFNHAPMLGSLIDPTRNPPDPMFTAGLGELGDLVARAMSKESENSSADEHEVIVTARGVSDAAQILAKRYTLVATNVPFLKRGKQVETVQDYSAKVHGDAKGNLACTFVDRCMEFLAGGGTLAVVTINELLFLGTYKGLRRRMLRESTWNIIARLGAGAFETIGGEVVNVSLLGITRARPVPEHVVAGIDVSSATTSEAKSAELRSGRLHSGLQSKQLDNPDARILIGEKPSALPLLSAFAEPGKGSTTGDSPHYHRQFWELPMLRRGMVRWLDSPHAGDLWSGRSLVCIVSVEDEGLLGEKGAMIRGQSVWGRRGLAVNKMTDMRPVLYTGEVFDDNVGVLCPADETLIPAILCYCESEEYVRDIRKLDQALKVTAATLAKVPFDEARWRAVAADRYPHGLPGPSFTNPTQWIFRGNIRTSDAPLHVAVARLLGYRWPDQQPDDLDAHADADGIVCIPALRGERPATDRLTDLLAAAWGKDWHPQTLTDLLAAVGHKDSLEEWLRDGFFRQHCELFHHRPFIWHIWDGHREGFSALVNYHKLDHETLKSLTWSYLGDWIRTQEAEAKAGKSGAADKLAKAKILQQRLAAILEGEAPLDVFVRWKSIEEQPIGWHPDLDDGVRLNIRPFLTVADVGARGAGVLRWKPNIKWGKDRGKNGPGSSWGEDRDNDRHLTLAEKRAARGET